jgi:CPA2 family monovalent cation:H+ antiporter-2
VVEDLFTVLVLVLLPVIFPAPAVAEATKAAVDQVAAPAAAQSNVWVALAWATAKIGALVVFVMVVGGRVIPWILARVAITRSRELFTLTVLVLALGIAVGAAKLFGVSMALGAFLAGMVVGQSDFSSRAASEALPMRDAFAVLFFVSVGMLFNPAYFLERPILVAATLAIVLIGKPLAALAIVLLLNYPLRVALAVAVALAQIGEFSFILAELGMKLDILDESGYSALIAAAIVSISLNPLLYRLIDAMENRAKRSPALSKWLNARAKLAIGGSNADDGQDTAAACAIVVGYGPVGRTLVRMLQENDIRPVVIEMNLETVRRLREEGVKAVYGDATHRETIKEAGAIRAIALILTSAGMHGSDETIRIARDLNPAIRVFARATYLREVPGLRKAGADIVFSSEGEVAMRMTEFLLEQLGATGEQIDREVDRIREELFGSPATIELLLPPPGHTSQPPVPDTLPGDGNLQNQADGQQRAEHLE